TMRTTLALSCRCTTGPAEFHSYHSYVRERAAERRSRLPRRRGGSSAALPSQGRASSEAAPTTLDPPYDAERPIGHGNRALVSLLAQGRAPAALPASVAMSPRSIALAQVPPPRAARCRARTARSGDTGRASWQR